MANNYYANLQDTSNTQGGNEMAFPWMPVAAAVSTAGSAIKDKGGAKYEQNWPGRVWAGSMEARYPELKGLKLPGIAPEAMELISMLMKGGLPPEMIKALGLGAEQEYGTALAGMPQGVGPIALGKMRAGVMGRLGQTKAMMGFQGMQVGLGAVPQISELMMQPQKYSAEEQRRRWTDIAGMRIGADAAKLKAGQQAGGLGAPGYSVPTYSY